MPRSASCSIARRIVSGPMPSSSPSRPRWIRDPAAYVPSVIRCSTVRTTRAVGLGSSTAGPYPPLTPGDHEELLTHPDPSGHSTMRGGTVDVPPPDGSWHGRLDLGCLPTGQRRPDGRYRHLLQRGPRAERREQGP